MCAGTDRPPVFKCPQAIWEFSVYASRVNSAKQAMAEAWGNSESGRRSLFDLVNTHLRVSDMHMVLDELRMMGCSQKLAQFVWKPGVE